VSENFAQLSRFRAASIERTGTATAIGLFCAGRGEGHPDIIVASRAMWDSEYRKCQGNGVRNITEIQIGYQGIVLAGSSEAAPLSLSTTNRRVTGETWYAAREVAAMLHGFDMNMDKPSWAVNRWLTSLLRLFRPQIGDLLRQRDERVRQWQMQNPDVNTYEDRRLEVTSQSRSTSKRRCGCWRIVARLEWRAR
jgi:PBP superfamily domain